MINVEQLQEDIANKNITDINKLLDDYHEADIAEVFEELTTYEMVFLLRILETDLAAEVFYFLESDLKEKIIDAYSSQEISEMIDSLYSDDIVDMVDEMPANIQKKILKNIPREKRDLVNALLMYDDDLAGSIMTIEFLEIKDYDTCGEALRKIKAQAGEVEYVDYIYVIDKYHELVGGITIKDLIIYSDDSIIDDIMDSNQMSVNAMDNIEDAIDMIRKYDYTSVPVLNHENRLIGIITMDDIFDAMDEEATEDIHKMAAVSPIEESYKKISIFKMYRNTIGWLLILMITATLTQTVMQKYDDVLAASAALALYIPMLMNTGGNAGGQSSTIVIRALVLNEIDTKDFFYVIKKELGTAILLGVTLAAVNLVRMYIIGGFVLPDFKVAAVITFTIIFTVAMAKSIGGILPLVAQLFKQDPAVMAGPLISTIVDALTLVVYFNLAKLILNVV
ncbi:MAG: magnesium transporter [Erysipelotrichales bacterium]